jgi:predicted transcriptional regulator YheO
MVQNETISKIIFDRTIEGQGRRLGNEISKCTLDFLQDQMHEGVFTNYTKANKRITNE